MPERPRLLPVKRATKANTPDQPERRESIKVLTYANADLLTQR
jgi:hypothetical protein